MNSSFAPWCPACKNLESVWSEYSIFTRDLDVKCAKVDVTLSPGLSGRFFVTALPTIFHVKDGEFRQYRGSRDLNSFVSFLENKKWEDLETISSWKKPDSIPMSILSLFFRFSNFIKVSSIKIKNISYSLIFEHLTVTGFEYIIAQRIRFARMGFLCIIRHSNNIVGLPFGSRFSVYYRFYFPSENITTTNIHRDKSERQGIIGT